MTKYIFFIFILLFGLSLQAQSLIGINVDDLSDAQVLSIFEKGKAQGLTLENGCLYAALITSHSNRNLLWRMR